MEENKKLIQVTEGMTSKLKEILQTERAGKHSGQSERKRWKWNLFIFENTTWKTNKGNNSESNALDNVFQQSFRIR